MLELYLVLPPLLHTFLYLVVLFEHIDALDVIIVEKSLKLLLVFLLVLHVTHCNRDLIGVDV